MRLYEFWNQAERQLQGIEERGDVMKASPDHAVRFEVYSISQLPVIVSHNLAWRPSCPRGLFLKSEGKFRLL
jgi:hypothetical protein